MAADAVSPTSMEHIEKFQSSLSASVLVSGSCASVNASTSVRQKKDSTTVKTQAVPMVATSIARMDKTEATVREAGP